MTRSYSRNLVIFFVLSLGKGIFLSGCSTSPGDVEIIQTPGSKLDLVQPSLPLPISSRDFLVGTAGLVPPNFPDPKEADYLVFLEELPRTGELLGVYVDWAAEDRLETMQFGAANGSGLKPLVALGFDFNQVDETYFSRNLPEIRDVITAIFDSYNLEYFAFGVEVNRLIPEASPDTFLDFVYVYREVYDLVKSLSPDTKVFTIFQLENLKGAAYLTGLEFESHWEILELFSGKQDLVGLTIYPFLEYTAVNQIPDDYFDEIAALIDQPIAITEMAWLSENISIVEGSEVDQVDFLLRILDESQGWDLELMMYSFLYDPSGAELFESAGLHQSSGEAKQIYDYWLSLVSLGLDK